MHFGGAQHGQRRISIMRAVRSLVAMLAAVLSVDAIYDIDATKCAKKITSDDCFLEGTEDAVSAVPVPARLQ